MDLTGDGAVRRACTRRGAAQGGQLNAAGGVDGRPLEISVIDTQLDPEQTKAAAIDLIDNQGAEVLLVTCDVDFAATRDPGGAEPGRARPLAVHRNRPDGAAALR